MADPVTNPQNPEEVDLSDQTDDAPDLESQVDDLLAEVTETVEEITRKLAPDEPGHAAPKPDYPDTDELEGELAALADDSDLDDSEATIAEPGAEPDAAAEPEPELETVVGPAEDTAPQDAPADAPEDTVEPSDDLESEDPQIDQPVEVLEDVAAALESTSEPEPEPINVDEPAAETAPQNKEEPQPEAADDSLEQPETEEDPEAEEDPESEDEPTNAGPLDYTDSGALEDELAALAGDTDLDDLGGLEEEAVAPEAPAEPEATPEPAKGELSDSLDDELAALAADALDEDLEHVIAPASSDEPAPEPKAEPQPAAATAEQEPESEPQTEAQTPAPKAEPVPSGPLKWGWLPPKPDWPEVYSKLRPLIIAWRHALWIVPPLLVHVGLLIFARTKVIAIKAEPRLRHIVAVVASPLSCREDRTRSIIGWFAVYTFFVATCLWIYVLIGRSPVVPVPTSTPTTLTGEQAEISASIED